jgi:hypothetical protein
MKINPKLYEVAEGKTPVEVQDCDGRSVEVFLMNDLEGVKDEYVLGKGQFAVWTSVDGSNYRLYIGEGYYEAVKPLYGSAVNKVWLAFWDVTDAISKKFSRFIIDPLMILAVVLCVLSLVLSKYLGDWGSWVIISVLIALFIVMIVSNPVTKKKIAEENVKSRQQIVDFFGEEEFNSLIDQQKAYMDPYFENLYPAEDAEETTENEALDAPTEEAVEEPAAEEAAEEVVEEKVEEAPAVEAVEEATVEEGKEEASSEEASKEE